MIRLSNRKYIIWIISTILSIIIILFLFAFATVYIDPLFHYHAPLENFAYPLSSDKERYLNDGIIRNFDYDAIITGTSMTENFMKSEADQIFNACFIKIPFSGGYYKEVNDTLKRAYLTDKNIKYVIRCLDYSLLVKDKDSCNNSLEFPTYLYNNNLFDDLNYILNKSIFIDHTWAVIEYTKAGNETTNFDTYANWNANWTFGAKAVLNAYNLESPVHDKQQILTKEEETIIVDNLRQNVTDLADEHPETTFYLFFPPYSICYWDSLQNDKKIYWHIAAELVAIEELLKHSNIKFYSFSDCFELTCNLDNYKDQAHYGEWVNSWILEWMIQEEHLLTQENYLEYIRKIKAFYSSYDYHTLRI